MKRKKLVISVVIAVVVIVILLIIGLSHRGQNKGADASEYTNTIKDSSTESTEVVSTEEDFASEENVKKYNKEARDLWEENKDNTEIECTQDDFIYDYVENRKLGLTADDSLSNVLSDYEKVVDENAVSVPGAEDKYSGDVENYKEEEVAPEDRTDHEVDGDQFYDGGTDSDIVDDDEMTDKDLENLEHAGEMEYN